MSKKNKKSISQKIAERIRSRLEEKITLEDTFSDSFIPDKREDTILNFIVDRTLLDAITNPNIEKLVKIEKLAEEEEIWSKLD